MMMPTGRTLATSGGPLGVERLQGTFLLCGFGVSVVVAAAGASGRVGNLPCRLLPSVGHLDLSRTGSVRQRSPPAIRSFRAPRDGFGNGEAVDMDPYCM